MTLVSGLGDVTMLAAAPRPALHAVLPWLPGAGDCVLANCPPSLDGELPSETTLPMRSGIASMAKPTKESDPSASAAVGAQRQANNLLGIPLSRIQAEA
jgi:hypothetical protein